MLSLGTHTQEIKINHNDDDNYSDCGDGGDCDCDYHGDEYYGFEVTGYFLQ
jgi:hypothetical protein